MSAVGLLKLYTIAFSHILSSFSFENIFFPHEPTVFHRIKFSCFWMCVLLILVFTFLFFKFKFFPFQDFLAIFCSIFLFLNYCSSVCLWLIFRNRNNAPHSLCFGQHFKPNFDWDWFFDLMPILLLDLNIDFPFSNFIFFLLFFGSHTLKPILDPICHAIVWRSFRLDSTNACIYIIQLMVNGSRTSCLESMRLNCFIFFFSNINNNNFQIHKLTQLNIKTIFFFSSIFFSLSISFAIRTFLWRHFSKHDNCQYLIIIFFFKIQ